MVLANVVRKNVPLDSRSTNPLLVSLIMYLRISGIVQPKSFESLARLHFTSAILNRTAIRWVLPNSKKILAVSSKAQVSLSSIKEVEPLLSCIIIHLGVDSYSISCSIHDITLFTLRCQTKYCTYACLPILSVYELLRYQRKHIIRNNNDYHCGYKQLATATVPQFFKKL